jgi:hypothetical protein
MLGVVSILCMWGTDIDQFILGINAVSTTPTFIDVSTCSILVDKWRPFLTVQKYIVKFHYFNQNARVHHQ